MSARTERHKPVIIIHWRFIAAVSELVIRNILRRNVLALSAPKTNNYRQDRRLANKTYIARRQSILYDKHVS